MPRMNAYRKGHKAPVAFNATPLVDMIFTLSIFFMLVTRFSSAEQVPMQLPKPQQSQAEVLKLPTRVIVNCRLSQPGDAAGESVHYSIGPNRPEPIAAIADRLAAIKKKIPDIQVVIRADKRLAYGDVRTMMRIVAELDIEVLNVVAHVDEGQ